MSTGGFALLLDVTPNRFPGLTTIGKVVYIFDLVLFVLLCAAITTRFIFKPGALPRSLKHPQESLFFGTFWLSMPTIIAGMNNYGVSTIGAGGEWLVVTIRVLFWIYVACTLLVALFQYWYLFTAKEMTIHSMMPSWILPIFPQMLSGTVASVIASNQPPAQRLPIIVAGVTCQGLGMMVSFMLYGIYIGRLMQDGLPAPSMRPGMFIAVGPPAFTALALIGMSNALPQGYGYFAAHPMAVDVLQPLALWVAIFLWALAFWFFSIAVVSLLQGIKEMSFSLVL